VRASSAPKMPTPPQPAICQGVKGPCPKKTFDASAPTAPTTKPGAAPSAKPESSTMSVVGLTLGSGAKATRPSAASAASVATRASTLADGCARSYQAKPSASASASMAKDASCQVMAAPPG
jgi:hypothetical protein